MILGADARYAAHELRDAKDVAKKYCGVAEKPHAYLASLLEESKKMTQNWSLRSRFCMGCLGDMLYKYLNVSYKHIVSLVKRLDGVVLNTFVFLQYPESDKQYSRACTALCCRIQEYKRTDSRGSVNEEEDVQHHDVYPDMDGT